MSNPCRPGRWEIQLKELRVITPEDGGGDEPYLVLIGFRSTFDTPGSTKVLWSGVLRELGGSVKSGQLVRIPRDVGVVQLGEVDPADGVTVVGGLVLAFESDATPWNRIRALINKLMGKLKDDLDQNIENGSLLAFIENPDAANEMVKRIKTSMELNLLQMLYLWDVSWSDRDELIGVQTLVYLEGPGLDWLNMGDYSLLSEQIYDLGTNPICFDNDDAIYAVSGRMTSTVLRAGQLVEPTGGTNWWGSVDLSVELCPRGHHINHVNYKAHYDKGDGQGPKTYTVSQRDEGEGFDTVWDIIGVPRQNDVEVWAELVSISLGGSVESEKHHVNLNIDSTPPRGHITLPIANSFHGQTMKFAADVTDKQSGVERVDFVLQTAGGSIPVPDSGKPQNNFEVTWDISHLAEQVVSVKATAFDRQGNKSDLADVPNVTIDHTPPDVQVLYPSSDPTKPTWIKVLGTISLRARVQDPSSIQEVRFERHFRNADGRMGSHRIGTVTSSPNNNEFFVDWKVSQIPDQDEVSEIVVTAVDNAGNTGHGIGYIAGFDRVLPTVRIVNPPTHVYRRGGELDIEVEAYDDLGQGKSVQKLEVFANILKLNASGNSRVDLADLPNASGWKGLLDLDSLPEQTLSIVASATDKAGNTNFVGQHITIDRTAPLITNVRHSPEPYLTNGQKTMTIEYRLSEVVRHVHIMLHDQMGVLIKSLKYNDVNTDPHVAEWDGKDDSGVLVKDGIYSYSIEAIDRAYNINSHPGGLVTVTVDSDPPDVRFIRLDPNPFNSKLHTQLIISYEQNETAKAEVEVLDRGHVIRYLGATDGSAGEYQRVWDAMDYQGGQVVPPGAYEIRIRVTDLAGNQTVVTDPIQIT